MATDGRISPAVKGIMKRLAIGFSLATVLVSVGLVVYSVASLVAQDVPAPIVQSPAGTRLDQFITHLAERGFSGGVLVSQRGHIVLKKGTDSRIKRGISP